MIIDTIKLKQAVASFEETFIESKSSSPDLLSCPIRALHDSDNRYLERIDLIERVEQLNNELSSLLVTTGG